MVFDILLNLVVWALSVDAILTAWFYGDIFERPLNFFTKWSESKYTFFWFIGKLLSCPICLAYHVSFWTGILIFVPVLFMPEDHYQYWMFIFYSLAVTSVVHKLQDVKE